MEKASTDMMSGVKLGPGSSHGHPDVNPTRKGGGRVNVGVALEVPVMSPPWHEDINQGRPKRS